LLDVHPPHHAAHSWRDFFIHIATIVVGLLIAVGLEQSVEHLHWRHEVEAQRAAMDAELSENAAFAYERLVATPCLDSRLTELKQAVLASGPKWAGDRMQLGGTGLVRNEAYEAPLRPWPDQAWRNGLASGAAAHMREADWSKYATAYDNVERIHNRNLGEQEKFAELDQLGEDMPMSASVRDSILKVIALARYDNAMLAHIDEMYLHQFEDMGLGLPKARMEKIYAVGGSRYGVCAVRPTAMGDLAEAGLTARP
jgi:hypothetical protein